jgi:hypothetical protein
MTLSRAAVTLKNAPRRGIVRNPQESATTGRKARKGSEMDTKTEDRPQAGTLKQLGRWRFLHACARYRELLREGLTTDEAKREFVAISIPLHSDKQFCPKSWWPMPNRIAREVAAEKAGA